MKAKMIVEHDVRNTWEIYSAEQFRREFNIKEERQDDEADEDFILRHLEEDNRVFDIQFIDYNRSVDEEFWLIKEIKLN